MKPAPLSRLILVLTLILPACLVGAETAPKVVSLGNNTYSITVSAKNKFTRNTQKLKTQAMETATQFCAQAGKQFKLVSVDESKSMYLVGDMASTKITFKALEARSPELAATTTESPALQPATVRATPTDSLYSELIKLDELRKKGILTDDEFAAEKRRFWTAQNNAGCTGH